MSVGKRNVIGIDVDLHRSQVYLYHKPAIDWNYFIVNWDVDGTHALVRLPFVVDCCLTTLFGSAEIYLRIN
jgi:hypothetical protein